MFLAPPPSGETDVSAVFASYETPDTVFMPGLYESDRPGLDESGVSTGMTLPRLFASGPSTGPSTGMTRLHPLFESSRLDSEFSSF